MDIFAFAKQMEKDSEQFYRDLVRKTGSVGLKRILTLLADEEAKHQEIVGRMSKQRVAVPDTPILDHAVNIFAEMKDRGQSLKLGETQIDLYRQAQELEERSKSFYLDKAQESPQPEIKEIFVQLAREEEKHSFLLENIIEFLSRPKEWLENAEWHHLEEY